MKTTLADEATDAEWIHSDTVFEESLGATKLQRVFK
jgi:hypothetical protein